MHWQKLFVLLSFVSGLLNQRRNIIERKLEDCSMSNTVMFESQEDRDWFVRFLNKNQVDITFIKKDGSERIMTCTLNPEYIPEDQQPKNSKKAKSESSLPVFDLGKQEWRSFRWDSVKAMSFSI